MTDRHNPSFSEFRMPERRMAQSAKDSGAGNSTGSRRVTFAALLGLLVVGTALRLYRIGDWPFAGDEIFTFRDSITAAGFQRSRPLLYILNYVVVRPVTALDELGLRLLPLLFGILAIPAMYWVGRRLLGARAGLLAALLVTVSPAHVLQSQDARYWTLVFLLSAVYPTALYLGVREQRPWYLVVGFVGAVLATLAHPSATLLLGSMFVWVLITTWLEGQWTSATAMRYRWQILVAVAVLLGIGAALIPTLRNWVVTPRMERLRGPALLVSYVDILTPALILLAGGGVWWLWRTRQRSLAVLLACLMTVSPLFLAGLSTFAAVATFYLFATAPAAYLAAAAFFDRLASSALPRAERRLVFATLLVILLCGNLPLLLSHYRDGGRPDFRKAAQFLEPRLAPGDRVLSDQSRVLTHYLKRPGTVSLPNDQEEFLAEVSNSRGSGQLWLVALTSSRGGFKTHKLGLGKLSDWVYAHCQLMEQIGVARLDFRQNEIQIYRCPPEGSAPF